MKIYGRAPVNEFLGDWIVYRNLAPCDARLPGLESFRSQVGLPAAGLPRKSEPDYARAIVHILGQAQGLHAPRAALKRLVFIGDTHLLDATAFRNICQAAGWAGWAFIGSENRAAAKVETQLSPSGSLYLSNRWAALADFDSHLQALGFAIDEATVVITDLDKTALAARGRNGHVIDQARVQAVEKTVAGLLAESFDRQAFLEAYNALNQPEFHPFTADNQDYLAYVCLILGSGLVSLNELLAEVRSGRLQTFDQFIERIQVGRNELPADLASIHSDIYRNVRSGDPTPFKAFRRTEYLETVQRMGCLPDDTPLDKLLENEILVTQEVRRWVLTWAQRGALVFGLSDKPDEASLPSPELAAQGFQPIHRTLTHVVGE
jgi:hypothetical protein